MTDSASLIITPNAYQEGALLGYRPSSNNPTKVIPVEINCVRAAATPVARRRNKAGVWVTCNANTPRLSWNVGGTQASWLVEPQSTNQIPNCRTYNLTSGTLTGGQADMFGGNSATLVQANAGGIFRSNDNVAHVVSTVYASGCLLKVTSGSVTFTLNLNSISISNATGSITLTPTSATPTGAAGAIDMGNGWYWCYLVYTAAAIEVGRVNFTTSAASTYLADVCQREVGTLLTSPLITAGSTVTRNADVISRTGIADLIGQTEGIILFDGNFRSNNPGSRTAFNLFQEGATSNRIQMFYGTGSNVCILNVIVGGVAQSSFNIHDNFEGRAKIVLKYAVGSNQTKVWRNGVLVGTATSAAIPTTNGITFGNSSVVTSPFNDTINEMKVYKTAGLSDAECLALSNL